MICVKAGVLPGICPQFGMFFMVLQLVIFVPTCLSLLSGVAGPGGIRLACSFEGTLALEPSAVI